MSKAKTVFEKLAKQQTVLESMTEHGKALAILGAQLGAGFGVTRGVVGKLAVGLPFRTALPSIVGGALKGAVIGGGSGVAVGALGTLLNNNRTKKT